MCATSDQYKTVCRKRFDDIEEKVDAVDHKLFRSNGEQALVDVVRHNTQTSERLQEDIAAIKACVVPESGIEISKKGLVIKGMKAGDIPKILLLVIILLYMVFRDHGEGVIQAIVK